MSYLVPRKMTGGFFESRVVEDFMDYKELVRPIEEEIVKSGSVYK